MIVLGIDPGFSSVGLCVVGVIQNAGGLTVTTLHGECVTTAKSAKKLNVYASDDNHQRAAEIAERISKLCYCYRVQAICAESQSWPRNASVAAKLGMCWGVISAQKLPVFQVPPQALKFAATGSKTASKEQIKATLCDLDPALVDALVDVKQSLHEHVVDAYGAVYACVKNKVLGVF